MTTIAQIATYDEWRVEIDKALALPNQYHQVMKERGYLSQRLTGKLNHARDLAAKAEAEKEIPHTAAVLKKVKSLLNSIDDIRLRLSYLNRRIADIYFPEEKRVSDNQEWKKTSTYMNTFWDSFFENRHNLFILLFILTDCPDEEAILNRADPQKKDMTSLPVPDLPLKTQKDDGKANAMLVNISGPEFHGFPDKDGREDDDGEEDDDDPNATVIGVIGSGQSGLGLNAAVGGGLGAGTVGGGLGAGAVGGGLGADGGVDMSLFTGTKQKTTQGQLPVTSTLKAPLNIAAMNTNTQTNTHNQYKLFSGPSLFENVWSGQDQQGLEKSPIEQFQARFQNDHIQQNDFQDNVSEANDAGTGLQLLKMFSTSLSSNFNANNIVKEPWDGDPQKWEKFAMDWIKADEIMSSLGFSDANKFNQLLSCTTSVARTYCKGYNSTQNASYSLALKALYEVYNIRKNTARSAIKTFLDMPTCTSTYKSRISLHAGVSSYRAGLATMGITAEQALFLHELEAIEGKMDQDLRRSWIRYVEKNRCETEPLGYKINFEILCNQILKFSTESYKMGKDSQWNASQDNNGARGQQQGRRWIGAAAGNSKSTQNTGMTKGQSGNPQKTGTKPGKVNQFQQQMGQPVGAHPSGPQQRNVSNATTAVATTQQGQYTRQAPYSQQGQYRPTAGRPPGQSQGPQGLKKGNLYKNGCVWCTKPNGWQEYGHRYNRSCPILKTKSLSAERIRDVIRAEKLCHSCLGKSHTQQECRAPDFITCGMGDPPCTQKHYWVFHGRQEPRRGMQFAAPAVQGQ